VDTAMISHLWFSRNDFRSLYALCRY